MAEDDLPDRLVLRPSVLKWTVMLVLSGGFTGLAAWLLAGDRSLVVGWFGLAFFGLGALVCILAMLPGANALTLERDAFTVRQFYVRRWSRRWVDTGPFHVWTLRGGSLVAFDEPARQGALAAVNRGLSGGSSALPDTYALGAHRLAALMERWRRRARRDAGLPE